ncbi:MAG: 50S ribosomal protein L4 [Candidatus Brocadiia bacterium]
MIELPVHNREGQTVGTVAIDEADFGGTVRHGLLRQVVLMYEANRRVGTASVRTRAEVRASGAKPWRQKGTGRARAGTRASPIWRGGGVTFGPKPRDYRQAVPRKAVRLATRSAYLARFRDGTTVVDEMGVEGPRTREVAAVLRALGIGGDCLIAIESYDADLWKSARNIPGVAMKPVREVNAYDLLRHRQLLITRPALEALLQSLRGEEPAQAAADAETGAAGEPPAEQAEEAE